MRESIGESELTVKSFSFLFSFKEFLYFFWPKKCNSYAFSLLLLLYELFCIFFIYFVINKVMCLRNCFLFILVVGLFHKCFYPVRRLTNVCVCFILSLYILVFAGVVFCVFFFLIYFIELKGKVQNIPWKSLSSLFKGNFVGSFS